MALTRIDTHLIALEAARLHEPPARLGMSALEVLSGIIGQRIRNTSTTTDHHADVVHLHDLRHSSAAELRLPIIERLSTGPPTIVDRPMIPTILDATVMASARWSAMIKLMEMPR